MSTRILVVEDDPTIGAGLVTAMQTNGYLTDWAETGRDALQRADADAPELILLDLGLPDLDGIEVCRQLRASAPEATIVMLTARHDEIDVEQRHAADDYMVTRRCGARNVSLVGRERRLDSWAVGDDDHRFPVSGDGGLPRPPSQPGRDTGRRRVAACVVLVATTLHLPGARTDATTAQGPPPPPRRADQRAVSGYSGSRRQDDI